MGLFATTLVGFIALAASLAEGKVYSDLAQLDSAKESYDFIVVGGPNLIVYISMTSQSDMRAPITSAGGIGGSTVASRLSENPRFNVLLIEAGPNNEGIIDIAVPAYFQRINSTYSWGHVTTPQIGLNNPLTNEKLVPPPGGRNASGQYDPRFHGFNGPTSVSLPWGGPTEFDLLAIQNAEHSEEIKFNLDVNSGKPSGLAKKELIISSGSFETPHLLLNSGIGSKPELESIGVQSIHHLPDVGKGLSDHLTFQPLGWSANGVAVPPVNNEVAFEEWRVNRTGPLTEAVGHQLTFARIGREVRGSVWNGSDPAAGVNSPHIEIAFFTVGPQVMAFIVLLTPKSRGSVKLASPNPLTPPLIDLGFLTHPSDLLAITEGIRIAKRWFEGPAYSEYITGFLGPDPDSTLSEQEFEDAVKERGS
ncbi:hypothetical protein MD484_g6870, partial [Candolleomyces efflorescens]